MNRVAAAGEAFVRGFKILVRDVACPIAGLYLAIRLGQGAFNVAVVPLVIGFTSAMIGIPYWSRADERKRGTDSQSRRKKSLTIDGSGIRWGEKSNDESPRD